jgi:hypothetical protein
MPHPGMNERKYPHIVELAVGEDSLDVRLGRRIMAFHNSRHIRPRHGHIILREGKTYYRWCFSIWPRPASSWNSSAVELRNRTAKSLTRDQARRIAVNIAKLPGLLGKF